MGSEIFLWILALIKPIIENPQFFGLCGGMGLFFWLSFMKREKKVLAGTSAIFLCAGVLWFFCWYLLSRFTAYNLITPVYWWGGFTVLGVIVAVFAERKILQLYDVWSNRATKKSALERGKKTDIRELVKTLVSIPPYDPEKYFKIKEGKWLIGMDENKKPVYYESADGNLGHFLITGRTGSGKTVLMACLGAQAILKGECTIVIDPKQNGDAFFPHVLRKMALKAGKRFTYIDLANENPQFNIVADGTRKQNELLLQNILSLDETGTDGDFFKGFGRDECYNFSQNLEEGGTIESYYKEYGQTLKADKNTVGFAQKLGELARIKSINAKNGISLKDSIENGDVIYIAGDWSDKSIVKAKTMVLARIIQIVSQRNNDTETPEPVCVIADELKFQVSDILSKALALIRDKGMHLILGCQTIANLRDCPANMDKEEFQKAVLGNCILQFSYALNDIETADNYSNLSGTILVDDEVRHLDKSLSLTETVSHERQVRQTETAYFDRNTLLALPKNCGIFFDGRLARMAHVSPIIVERSLETKKIHSFKDCEPQDKRDNPMVFEDLN